MHIGGRDINARTRIENGGIGSGEEEIEDKEESRKSKDRKVNRERSLLIDFVEERG